MRSLCFWYAPSVTSSHFTYGDVSRSKHCDFPYNMENDYIFVYSIDYFSTSFDAMTCFYAS